MKVKEPAVAYKANPLKRVEKAKVIPVYRWSRFDKIDDGKNIKSLMHQSLNWLISSIDQSGK